MQRFYLLAECGNCEADIYYGPVGTTITHRDLPVITYDTAACTDFTCDRCGASNYTGDFELETEGGSDDWDEPLDPDEELLEETP